MQGVIARGHCWKTKAPITGMPWGCLCAGIYGSWAPALAWVCKYMQAHDFMIAGPSGSRASFTYVMAQFRRILVSYGGIPADVVHNYSLHSLKATPLSWALQVEVEPTMSRLWGHHRSSEHGEAMVRAQRAVESAEGYLGRLGAFDPTGPRWQVASCRVRAGSEAAQPHGGAPRPASAALRQWR